ncbi:Ig-like domain-containing protein [Cellulomonas sp. URHD0024]|uniref:Ig-like domain-containing protein n=1 Tax=Cellulomonas sp. URHD0024 TaxID=1302620 RepID=UPI00042176B7|nr:Ig-like domain-containing protein [Cellulomonas sp. URHD0024]
MRTFTKSIAALAAGTLIAAAAVALAAPASAVDASPDLPGDVLWFNTVGPLAGQTPATQILTGANATNRPWATLTTANPCPAGSTSMAQYIRIPGAPGVPEIDWTQVQMGANATLKDADGRFYTTTTSQADRLNKAEVQAYQAAHPGTNTYPFISVCQNGPAITGNFRTLVDITTTTPADITSYTWTIHSAPITVAAVPTTTTVSASATSVNEGTPVNLTATLAPAGATGSVTFLNGATSLGSAALSGGTATLNGVVLPVGVASVTASYAGAPGFNASVSAPLSVTVIDVPDVATTTTLVVTPTLGTVGAANGLPLAGATTAFAASVTSATPLTGTCEFFSGATSLGTVPVTAGVVPAFSTNNIGAGAQTFTASCGGAGFVSSTSAPVALTFLNAGAPATPDDQTVIVTIPAGSIVITTPYTPAAPLDLGNAVFDSATSTYHAAAAFNGIVITDTRAGNLGFNASVVSSAFTNGSGGTFSGGYSGLTGLAADAIAGNLLNPADVTVSNHAPLTDGLDVPKVFATYPAGHALGSVGLHGTFGIAGVPTSVPAGTYTSTVTFTAV